MVPGEFENCAGKHSLLASVSFAVFSSASLESFLISGFLGDLETLSAKSVSDGESQDLVWILVTGSISRSGGVGGDDRNLTEQGNRGSMILLRGTL